MANSAPQSVAARASELAFINGASATARELSRLVST